MFESEPLPENPESEECLGAYINSWVNSDLEEKAFDKASVYITDEGWEITKVEEMYIACREQYENNDECVNSLECYDQAVDGGKYGYFIFSIQRRTMGKAE
jgi:hypothetical protein